MNFQPEGLYRAILACLRVSSYQQLQLLQVPSLRIGVIPCHFNTKTLTLSDFYESW